VQWPIISELLCIGSPCGVDCTVSPILARFSGGSGSVVFWLAGCWATLFLAGATDLVHGR
jgi:hypothetical protein